MLRVFSIDVGKRPGTSALVAWIVFNVVFIIAHTIIG